uniref:Uncharacterized protein n=1 Tax=Parascaris equorum TaxID=6256 RepID=A0A914RGP7_PAREQ
MYRHCRKLLSCSTFLFGERPLHVTSCLAAFKKGRGTGDQGDYLREFLSISAVEV